MKKFLVPTLVLVNLLAAVWLSSLLSTGYAGGRLSISDLTYGEIDADGDGACTFGDDLLVEWFVENSPSTLRKALRTCRVRRNGDVDLSPHLKTVNHRSIEAAKEERDR